MNSKNKLRLFIGLEILIWLFIIVFCVGAIKLYSAKKQGELRTYRIFMQDVDGLIEGSSVRLMGVPIGYVKHISIVQDHVYVKFVLTNKDIQLPQGVIATAEFNGMAGSNSLELYPPDEVSKASGNLVVIKKTNRLGAALGLFDDMFAKFDSIVVRCNHFSSQIENIMPHAPNPSIDPVGDADKSLGILNNAIEDANHKRLNLKKTISPILPKMKTVTETEEDNADGETNNEQE